VSREQLSLFPLWYVQLLYPKDMLVVLKVVTGFEIGLVGMLGILRVSVVTMGVFSACVVVVSFGL
jgi:hypothetical protein